MQLAKTLKIWPNFIEFNPDPIDLAGINEIRSAVISTHYGDAVIELYPRHAPLTVRNFARLADAGFYDHLTFHRVIPDFVVQGGDPRGDGLGGPDYTIPDEINELPYTEGTVGMALSGPDTGGSQWFVTLSPQPHLDGRYTVFGQVTQGLHVFRSILAGDLIVNVSIERMMNADDVHEVEMEKAAERLAALKANEAPTRSPKKSRTKKPDAESKKAPKKAKRANKDEEKRIDAPNNDPDGLPEDHEKKPEEAPLNEGEKIDTAALEEDTDSDGQ